MSRRQLAVLLTALAVVGWPSVTGAAADPDTPDPVVPTTTVTPTSWGYVDSATPRKGHRDPAGDAPVGAWRDGRGDHVARSYFTFDVAGLRGATVLSATLTARETRAADCAKRSVEVWSTDPFTIRSSWHSPPANRAKLASAGPVADACLADPAEVDVAAAVREALRRNESSVTVALRGGKEQNVHYGRWVAAAPALTVTHNSPPAQPTDPDTAGRGCAMQAPGPYLNPDLLNDGRMVLVSATVADPDAGDELTALVDYWPVDDPSARTTLDWLVDQPRETVPLLGSDLTDGVTYAWTARVSDGTATSPETAPCHFTVDKTAPEAPSVSSTDYPPDGYHGGPTVPGEFTFSANGSADVVGYEYWPRDGAGWEYVEADELGGPATATITPTNPGFNYVQVRSVDRAGARSWETSYYFDVFESRPHVFSAMYPEDSLSWAGGYGIAGDFEFSSNLSDVVEYRYRHDDGPEQVVAADAEGRATISIAPTRGGVNMLYVRSVSADGTRSPEYPYRFRVDTAPTVTGPAGGLRLGSPAEFRFAPKRPQVASYEYTLTIENEPQPTVTVPAGPDGTAGFTWTPTAGLWGTLDVRSRDADGTWSEHRRTELNIDGVEPVVRRTGANFPGEVGVFTFDSPMENVVQYEYFVDNPANTVIVPAEPDGTGRAEWTPDVRGLRALYVYARNADGVRSQFGSVSWVVRDAPVVTSPDFPPSGSGPLLPGTFTFASRLPGTVAFEYRLNNAPFAEVAPGPDGTATVAFTPTTEGDHYLQVRARTATGYWSSQASYTFSVSSAPGVSSTDYPENESSGGAGVTGTFHLEPWRTGVTGYEARFQEQWDEDPGPPITVVAAPDGTGELTWTPDAPGRYTLEVTSRTASGEISPVRRYMFWVY